MLKHGQRIIASAVLIGSAASGAVWAADAPAADAPAGPAAPSLTDVLTSSGLTATGYVAASYYHSNGYSTFHQFDVEHDTFQLDQAAFTLAYQPKEGFGALVNIAAGEDMRILHAAEDGNNNTFDVVQGFVQYAGGPITVIAGKYVTLVGAEVIAPTGNSNFSRSLLFYAEPLTHTGVRATYAVTDTVSLTAGVNNGWNTTSTSYGSKTGEFGVGWIPNKIFSVTAQAYVGKSQAYDAQRTIVDFVGTYNVTDSLTLLLSYDWGKQEQVGFDDLKWNGAAFYANYALADQFRVSGRVEYLDDKGGFVTGYVQTLKEATVTFGYDPVKSFELRLEVRYDMSNKGNPTFVRRLPGADESGPTYANSQTGLAIQGIYKF
jgi:Putative beta-barrel porin-2, OmpL-like. bbp2